MVIQCNHCGNYEDVSETSFIEAIRMLLTDEERRKLFWTTFILPWGLLQGLFPYLPYSCLSSWPWWSGKS